MEVVAIKLSVNGINYKIGEKVILSDINANFLEKGRTSIIGPNGAGKSTLLKILCLMNEKFEGEVKLGEKSLKSLGRKKISQVIAILPQEKKVPQDTTVKELVGFGRFPHRKWFGSSEDDKIAVEWALSVTKLKKLENRQVNSLSGGERQRAWLAMTLAQKPEILLLDEPTTYLDVAHQLEVMEIINLVNKNFGITVISVLHDINHARMFSDEVIVIKNGKIFLQGEPKKILTLETVEEIFEVKADIFKNSCGMEMIIPIKNF